MGETYEFIKTVYRDLFELFPDRFIHVGGDEVQLSELCWLQDKSIVDWMENHQMNTTLKLYEYFETRLFKIVTEPYNSTASKMTPIVWQEVFDLNLTIPSNTIIDVWKGFDKYTIQNATNQNYRVIL